MKKEHSTKPMTVMLQPSLYEKFEKTCNAEHRSMSEVVREFLVKYSDGWILVPHEKSIAPSDVK
jgi:hypothetical protein